MASEIMSNSSPTAVQSTTNGLNRRSLSIFSRRGADTPTPATQALALTSMSMALTSPPSTTTPVAPNKAKRWKLSKNLESRIPEGTILRAVPKDSPKVALTPLEREMATSPNDEILRNIGFFPESAPTSPIQQIPSTPLADITNTSHSPKRYYSKKERKNSQNDIIGVWRNGKAQWDSGKSPVGISEDDGRPKTSSGLPELSGPTQDLKESRPKIQVVIPHNPSFRRPFSFVPFFSNTTAEQPSSKSIMVSHSITQDISPPSVTSQAPSSSFLVSAISPETVPHMPKPRMYIPISTSIAQSPAGLFPERPAHERTPSNTSNSSDSGDDNASQCGSNRSSMTSLGVHESEEDKSRRDSSSSVASVQKSEEASKRSGKLPISRASTSIARKRVPKPLESIRTEGLKRPIPLGATSPSAPPKMSRPAEGPRLSDLVGLVRTESTQRPNARRLSSRTGHKQLARIDSKEELRSTSPTLSEAERGLEAQLTTFWPPVQDQQDMDMYNSVPDIYLPAADVPPPPPRKSSKRKARITSTSPSTSKPEVKSAAFLDAVEVTRKARMQRQQQLQKIQETKRPRLRRVDSVRSVLSLVAEDDEFTKVDAQAAEVVVYHILSKLSSMQDLFNTAVSNKAFYRVFKNNELKLMREVLHTTCPAAWECTETNLLNTEAAEPDSAAPAPEITPSSYFLAYSSDADIIDNVKEMLLERCQSLLRTEMLAEIQAEDPSESSRVDAALWRIWTFCRIFGCNKGREDDLIAQMDWLRGGLLAHQESCTSTISTSDSFYISSVLLSAPEHFAQGNNGGLTAEELYDMLEMWNCLSSITGDLIGKTEQARQFGVYDNTEVRGGDIDGEEAMLGMSKHIHLKIVQSLTNTQKNGIVIFSR
jgi:hypothetical protein